MGRKIIDKTGEEKVNSFGSKMVIKEYKEKIIKEVIDSYEGKIPEPHYSRLKEAMYNYEDEIYLGKCRRS